MPDTVETCNGHSGRGECNASLVADRADFVFISGDQQHWCVDGGEAGLAAAASASHAPA